MNGDGERQIIGRRIIHLPTTPSTMDEVAKLAGAGDEEGVVVRADRQTAGRGRQGRPWTVPAGSSILTSVLLRPTVPAECLTVLPLMIGVGVAKAIERTIEARCQLKWPNDVWIDERKVSGILMTARSAGTERPIVILGIGLNVNIPRGELVPGATSLLAVSDRRLNLDDVFTLLLAELDAVYNQFLAADGMTSLDEWRERAALSDELVLVRDGGEELSGWMRGIDDRGRLLLEVAPSEVRAIAAGELTRGPVRL